MPDIVEWLRGHKIQRYHEAAEEIERLWAALSWLEDHEPQLVDAAKEKFGIYAPPV